MSIVEANFSHSENGTLTGNLKYSIVDTGSFPELCITFHLHYISFALYLKYLPCQHEMHATL